MYYILYYVFKYPCQANLPYVFRTSSPNISANTFTNTFVMTGSSGRGGREAPLACRGVGKGVRKGVREGVRRGARQYVRSFYCTNI